MCYKSLGIYKPPKWRAWMVGRDITAITKKAGLVPLPMGEHRLHKGSWKSRSKHADVMRRRPPYDTADTQWHQDGDTTGAKMDCSLVVWSTNNPTQIKLDDGTIVQPQPYEVIVLNNTACYHRRPPWTPKIRWFFRQRVETPEWLAKQ